MEQQGVGNAITVVGVNRINLAHVATTHRDFAGRVTLSLKARPEIVAVSRAFAHRFRQM